MGNGEIQEIFKTVGDNVEQGEVIALIKHSVENKEYLDRSLKKLNEIELQLKLGLEADLLSTEQKIPDSLRLALKNTVDLAARQVAQISLAGKLQHNEIHSPISGKVLKIIFRQGSHVSEGAPFAIIQPQNGHLLAALRLSSKDTIRVAKGQKVRLQMEAYPWQTFGIFTGEVTHFEEARKSATDTEALDIDQYIVYSSVINPLNSQAKTKPTEIQVRLGMRFSAEVITERKALATIVFEKIFRGR
jgi:membrane fusion protein